GDSDYDFSSDTTTTSSKIESQKSEKKILLHYVSESEDISSSDGKNKKSKRSAILAKASDRVIHKQDYPQSHLRFEFVSNTVTFDKLDLNLFVAGESEISNLSLTKSERSAREIELGHLKWGDSFHYVETLVLSCHFVKKQVVSKPSFVNKFLPKFCQCMEDSEKDSYTENSVCTHYVRCKYGFSIGFKGVSPLNSVQKKDTFDCREILDLSMPKGLAVNDFIEKDWYFGEKVEKHIFCDTVLSMGLSLAADI
ncbi:hypothetical protein MAR_008032, partial [Mya arenaria]